MVTCLRADDRCEASAPTLQLLKNNIRPGPEGETRRQRFTRQAGEMAKLIEQHPGNQFLLVHLDSIQRELHGTASAQEWAVSEHGRHPDFPANATAYALTLWGSDTPRAIEILGQQGEFPWALHALARIHTFGKFKDATKARGYAEAFAKACPAAIERRGIDLVGEHGSPQTLARMMTAVRERLEKEPFVWAHRHAWESLWMNSFKNRPPTEFGEVRQQIRKDIEILETGLLANSPDGLRALARGSQRAGNAPKAKAFFDRLLGEHPSSDEARAERLDRWHRDNPDPKADASKDERLAAFTRIASNAEQEIAEKGESFSLLLRHYQALAAIDGPDKQRIVKSGLRAASRMAEEGGFMVPPLQIQVAYLALRYNVLVDQVPVLLKEAEALPNRFQETDYNDDEQLQHTREGRKELPLETAPVWLGYYRATGNKAEALAKLSNWRELPTKTLLGKFRRDVLDAQMAEWEGRKVDALILYRRAVARVGAGRLSEFDNARLRAADLLTEIGGGSDRLLAELESGRRSPQEAAVASAWQRKRDWKLPPFEAGDVKGGKWTRDSWNGKVVIANVWASWCGPCRMEHPEFEKLFQRVRNRQDLMVVSLNTDDDMSLVEPYMKEGGFSFPALFAKDLVDGVAPSVSIPRTWIISTDQQIEWEQIGFNPADREWVESALSKAEAMLKRQ